MRSDHLKRHMLLHGIFTTYQEKHKCIYCNYTSDKALSVARHIAIKHQAEGKDVLVKKKYGIEKYLKPMTAKDLPTRPSVIVANKLNITPPPPPPQPSPVGEAELINHMVGEHENGRDNVGNYTTKVNVIYRDNVKGKNKKVDCRICHRAVGSNNMKKHMKQHEKKQPQKVVMGNHPTVDEAALKNNILEDINEYQRKLELQGGVKQTNDVKPVVWRPWQEGSETLELFEKHEQDNDVKPVVWRPWQYELLKYVNNPTSYRIIWVVGGEGNEGKTFFMKKIRGQYGRHRVCTMPLRETTRNLIGCMQKVVDAYITDIFLFNVTGGGGRRMKRINYSLLEKIKDGEETVVVGNSVKRVEFTRPNVVMVFSNDYPDTEKFSRGRWMIFKINSEMQLEDVTEAQLKKGRGRN